MVLKHGESRIEKAGFGLPAWHSVPARVPARAFEGWVWSGTEFGSAAVAVPDRERRARVMSEQQFAPFWRHAAVLRQRLGIVFRRVHLASGMRLHPSDLARFDAIGLKLSFRTPEAEAIRIASHFRNATSEGARSWFTSMATMTSASSGPRCYGALISM